MDIQGMKRSGGARSLDQLIYEYQKLSMNENAPDNLLQDFLGCIDCLPVEKYTA